MSTISCKEVLYLFFKIMWQLQSTERIATGLVHRKIFFLLCAYFLLGRENFFLGQR